MGGGWEEGRWGGDGEETYSHESCGVCMRRVSLCYSIAMSTMLAITTFFSASGSCGKNIIRMYVGLQN